MIKGKADLSGVSVRSVKKDFMQFARHANDCTSYSSCPKPLNYKTMNGINHNHLCDEKIKLQYLVP